MAGGQRNTRSLIILFEVEFKRDNLATTIQKGGPLSNSGRRCELPCLSKIELAWAASHLGSHKASFPLEHHNTLIPCSRISYIFSS